MTKKRLNRGLITGRIQTNRGTFFMRKYSENDKSKILRLWEINFGKKCSPPLWNWKYDGPFEHNRIVCSTESGDIAAIFGGLAFKANFNGATIRIGQMMDNMSNPSHRNVMVNKTGLFLHTVQAFIDQYCGSDALQVLYGLSGKRHFLLGRRYMHYNKFSGFDKIRVSTSRLSRHLQRYFGRIQPLPLNDEKINLIFENQKQLYPFSVIRNRTFLKWRFIDHPEEEYTILGYRSWLHPVWKGYAVYSTKESTATLVDVILPVNKYEAMDFLGRIGTILNKNGIEGIETWIPNKHLTQKYFIETGFNKVSHHLEFYSTGRSFSKKMEWNWVNSNLYYTMGDSDLY